MAVKLSGLSSNLDTESIIKSLVSAYSVKKDNLVKAQTKLSWRQDSWKSMNTKIYSFYSKSLSNMRLSASFKKNTASISDATIAKVTASSAAVSGSQSLIVKKLATSGYLTGGMISTQTTVDGVTKTGDATESSKLSQVSGLSSFTGGSITVGTGEKTTRIDLTADTTISSLVGKLKDAGVNASFDEKNQRFFISAESSGAENDFTLTAANTGGLVALKSLGLFTVNGTDTAEYTKWAGYTSDEITALKTQAYDVAKTDATAVTTDYKNQYKTASDTVTNLTAVNTQYEAEKAELVVQKDNLLLTEEDKAAIDKEIAAIDAKITSNQTTIGTNQDKVDYLTGVSEDSNGGYVILDGDDAAKIATKTVNINNEVTSRNATIKTNVEKAIDDKVAIATTALATSGSSGAVRTVGIDSSITLNGADFTSSSNNYEINGLTIQALGESPENKSVTVTTSTDVDGIYNMIKDFFTGYNELVNGMDTAYNATSSKGYEPLTSDEKDTMTDTQIEEWEKKIKDSLLRKDTILSSVNNALKTDMLSSFTVNGKKYSLASFGINTLSYFTASDNEKGAYHIDGNSADTNTSGKTDKLRAAIANNPEAVTSFFSQLATKTYTDLTNRMQSSTLRSAYTIYNDKQMGTEYSEYTTKISDQTKKVTEIEDYYYKKFTAMEKALSKLNSNTSSLSSMLGS